MNWSPLWRTCGGCPAVTVLREVAQPLHRVEVVHNLMEPLRRKAQVVAQSYLRAAALVSFDEPRTSWDQLSLRSTSHRSPPTER